jgi:hypothetical protein
MNGAAACHKNSVLKKPLILTGWLVQRSRAFQPAKALGKTSAVKTERNAYAR